MPVSKKFRKHKQRQTNEIKSAASSSSALPPAPQSGGNVRVPVSVSGPSRSGRGKGKAPPIPMNARKRRNRRIAQEQASQFEAMFGKEVCDKVSPGDRAVFFGILKRSQSKLGEGETVSPDEILRQMISRRALYRAACESLINQYPALNLRQMRAPLAIDTDKFLKERHPAIPPEFIGQFLAWTASRPCYLDMIARGVPRRSLDGTVIQPISEEHRKNAAKALKRALRTSPKKVPSFRSLRYFYKRMPRRLDAAV